MAEKPETQTHIDELLAELDEMEKLKNLPSDKLRLIASFAALDGRAASDRRAKWAEKMLKDRGESIGEQAKEEIPAERLINQANALRAELQAVLEPLNPKPLRRPGPQFLEDLLAGREPGDPHA